MPTPAQSLVNSIKSLATSGCRLASFVYTAKGSGEIARHTVALGVNLERAYRRDLNVLTAKLPKLSGVAALACGELIASLKKSLEVGIGNNPAYTCADSYVTVAPGVKLHVENGELHVYGFKMGKTVLARGEHRHVNSSPKTLAKKELQKGLKSANFRQFAIGNLETVAMNGKTLVFS